MSGVLVDRYTNKYKDMYKLKEHNYYEAVCQDALACRTNIMAKFFASVTDSSGEGE